MGETSRNREGGSCKRMRAGAGARQTRVESRKLDPRPVCGYLPASLTRCRQVKRKGAAVCTVIRSLSFCKAQACALFFIHCASSPSPAGWPHEGGCSPCRVGAMREICPSEEGQRFPQDGVRGFALPRRSCVCDFGLTGPSPFSARFGLLVFLAGGRSHRMFTPPDHYHWPPFTG